MKRNKYSLSHYKLATMEMGRLIPIGCTEVLPGDTVQQATSALVRVSPLMAPVMHPVQVRIHHWFVPTRLVWTNFEKFITGGPDGNDATVPPCRHQPNQVTESSLWDYLGVPPNPTNVTNLSILPVRAYQLIYNENYRDQDLQAEAVIDKGDGNDSTTSVAIQKVCWEKDYFTAARPWSQKGDEVSIDLGGTADVTGVIPSHTHTMTSALHSESGTPNPVFAADVAADIAAAAGGSFDVEGTLEADLSGATSITINALKEAMALQRYKEARARYGSRYTEYLRSLGVKSSDSRLDRPEYLGGGRQTIQFSEVLQTGPDSSDEGVGSIKGHGLGALRSNRYRKFFEEHGYVITIMSVVPKTIYADGVPKMFLRTTKEDYFQKELQHIGQKEVLISEIWAPAEYPENVFGYQDRYDEYRRQFSQIAGEFRSTLNHWHLARMFGSQPTLNSDFVSCDVDKRVFADQTSHTLWVMINHSIQARRVVGRA